MNKPLSKQDLIAQASMARGQGASQATVVEQSRAVAEVQAAFMVAMNRPRDKTAALAEALESCATLEVAEGAFFRFPRGGTTVSGESIHLARELARCWGNITYGVVELARDDERGLSEMMAYGLDLQTNTRSHLTFIVPHKRDNKGGPVPITDMRDIYENNANMGARRLRECIFAVLPPYLVKAAADACRVTLEGGKDSKPLPIRITEAVAAFESAGISRDRIEARYGATDKLTPVDLANMRIVFQSIKRGEISAEQEFPRTDRVSAADLIGNAPVNVIPPLDPNEGGRANDDHGESHNAIDVAPWQAKVDGWLDRLGRAELSADVTAVEVQFKAESEFLPDDVAATVQGAIDGARGRIGGGK